MPQCQFLFSAVFGFRKVVQEIFLELDEIKCELPILLKRRRSQEMKCRRPLGGPDTGPGLAAPGLCLGTPGTASRRLFAYKKLLDLKVTGVRAEIHEKFCRGRCRQP